MASILRTVMGLTFIFGCYFVGKFLVVVFALSIPAPLVGLLLLLTWLHIRQRPPVTLAIAAQPLLKHMSVLFVPAVVGVGIYWQDITRFAWSITSAIILTTICSVALTAWLAQRLLSKTESTQHHD